MNTRKSFGIAAGLLVVLIIAVVASLLPNHMREESKAKAVVTDFGGHLKSISLMEPADLLREDIEKNYGPYVTKDLLRQWQTDLPHVPGQLTSSPWPDRIEVTQTAQQGGGYAVSGDIVLMTSTGEVGRIPVVLLVIPQGGGWKIAAYQQAVLQAIHAPAH